MEEVEGVGRDEGERKSPEAEVVAGATWRRRAGGEEGWGCGWTGGRRKEEGEEGGGGRGWPVEACRDEEEMGRGLLRRGCARTGAEAELKEVDVVPPQVHWLLRVRRTAGQRQGSGASNPAARSALRAMEQKGGVQLSLLPERFARERVWRT